MEELREAVEMLNDTVRERGRSQTHDQAIQELLSKVRKQPTLNDGQTYSICVSVN